MQPKTSEAIPSRHLNPPAPPPTTMRSVENARDAGDLSSDFVASTALDSAPHSSSRQPFTSMSQVDADLALARALQQQEHAYLLLHMGTEGIEYETSGSIDDECVHEEEEEKQAVVMRDGEEEERLDGSLYENDEAFARALQEAEQREAAAYMMSYIGGEDSDGEENDDESYESQDAWQDVDPDNMSYEELVALGEAVGTHSRGLNPDVVAAIPYSKFITSSTVSDDPCVICRFEYEDGDTLSTLPCKHNYHADCIKNWLQINKVCPICSAEVES